ncbi:hypothetical protein BGW38_010464 [Lunasporangiospora selenospora]|uniref:Amidohydrolase-related domain-containing protein n=1 Tax=Lunasporangiospora selenospora TaxID=979761 RepID=A0A9P6FWW2_9FUNG|nr:hypothetical protein BGW38_010464 [Lunasporangiospora selenospora]
MSDYQQLPQHDRQDDPQDDEPSRPAWVLSRNQKIVLLVAATALLATSAYLIGASNEFAHHPVDFQQAGISLERFEAGLSKCKAIRRKHKHVYVAPEERLINERFVNGTAPTLFKNGFILDGVSAELQRKDLLVDQGLIVQIGSDIQPPKKTVVVDLKGHIISPGIVDMHSHLGVFGWPYLAATRDFIERIVPVTPYVRSIDGFNPGDLAIERTVSGGVTSSLVLPGSDNVIGGESFAFKLRPVSTLSTEDMMPMSRLGEGWLLREQFEKATLLQHAQDDWCDAAESQPFFGRHRLNTAFPEDLKYESLVGILRDDVRLNIHCYETHDIEAMVRHSNEFKFKIRAFHHGLDAYRVPEVLKRAYKHIPTVATFATSYGYKKEAFQASVNGPKILAEAGISVALKSDHPVINSQHLVYEAQKARHYGLAEDLAFAAVTSVPAKALGLDHRIGKIAIGMDADVVIWERHPLALGARPLQVYIDGIAQIKGVDESEWKQVEKPSKFAEYADLQVDKSAKTCGLDSRTGIFKGIQKIVSKKEEKYNNAGHLKVVLKDGHVICQGLCDHEVQLLRDEKHRQGEAVPEYDLGGKGVLLPALLSVSTLNLGLIEIPTEESTGNGADSLETPMGYAADGLKFGGLHMEEAFKAGILVGVTAPTSAHVVQGVSVAFSTGAKDALSLNDTGILQEKTALHIRIGHSAKSKLFPTISSQIAFLRKKLNDALNRVFEQDDPFALAVRGSLPLVVEVYNRDEMVRLVQVKRDLEHLGARILLVFQGATEAWTIAEHLTENNVGVILQSYHCRPDRWTAQQCLAGPPLTKETGLTALIRAGVKVGLAAEVSESVRELSWTAAEARSDLGLTTQEAAGLLSWNLAELVGIKNADNMGMVLYSGNPFEFGAKVSAIIGGGRPGIACNPRAQ